MQQKIPVVHAASVTKVRARHKSLSIIFDEMTVTLPTNEICAVLGHSGSGRTTFLRLLSGAERPDSGSILTQVKFSIICNAGFFFHAGITGLENIKLAARLYGMDAGMLTEITLGLSNFGADWQIPIGVLPGRSRKTMEMLVAALLPFDCYLVDDAERVDPDTLALVLEILRLRQAGMIFTAQNPKFVGRFATIASVIANQTVCAFDSIEEALKNYA